MSVLENWSTYFTNRESLTTKEVEALEKSGLPLSIELLSAVADVDPRYTSVLEKAIETSKKPKGPVSNRPSVDKAAQNPGSINGVKAPRQETRGRASNDAATVVAPEASGGGESATDVLYISKRDHPKRPLNCIGETPHSWKVPLGSAQPTVAEDAERQGDSEQEEQQQPEAPPNVLLYSKQPKNREVLTGHLSGGKIVDIRPLGAAGCTDSSKIIISGNGAGVMKPDVETLYEQTILTSKEEPKNKFGWSFNSESKEWQRVEAKQYDMFHPKAIGSFGSGCVPFKKNVQREVAAYHVSNLLGVGSVPVTVKRYHNGKAHSVQDFKPGCQDVVSLLSASDRDPDVTGERLDIRDELKKRVPADKWADTEQRLKDMAVFDMIINNQDRHAGNLIVDTDSGDVHFIDHGFAFGNSTHGSRNYLMQHVFHGNEAMTMSDTLRTRIKNTSLSDFTRAMPELYDWEVGQTFLRSRYVLWQQENHGSIDREKFLHTQVSNDGSSIQPGDGSAWNFGGASRTKQVFEHLSRKEAGHLPYQLFESWAKAYLAEAASDKSHPDHVDASSLQDLGVFMAAGFPSVEGGAEAYRKAGKHKEYEKTIKASMDIPKRIPRHSDPVENAEDSSPQPAESATVNVSHKRKPR